MNIDWRHLSREARLPLEDGRINMGFADSGRSHTVYVDETQKGLRLWGIVAKPARRAQIESAELRAWLRNRVTELVGFKTDRHGRLIGEAWVPEAGLTADEWAFYVNTVARVCDHFEYVLTGRDVE